VQLLLLLLLLPYGLPLMQLRVHGKAQQFAITSPPAPNALPHRSSPWALPATTSRQIASKSSPPSPSLAEKFPILLLHIDPFSTRRSRRPLFTKPAKLYTSVPLDVPLDAPLDAHTYSDEPWLHSGSLTPPSARRLWIPDPRLHPDLIPLV
jgi:hypothetical protein